MMCISTMKHLEKKMEMNYRSTEIGKLVGSLAKAQGSYKPLNANEDGPRGKFANLEATISAVKESLDLNKLSFTQHTTMLDDTQGAVMLLSLLAHESDQWLASWARIISGETLRETGINTEIVKRRQAQMLLGIAPSKNDPASWDDDGASMAEKHLMKEIRKPLEDRKSVNRDDVIDKRQYDELMLELEGYPALAEDIMKIHQIDTIADLPHTEYYNAITKIRKIKVLDSESNRRR